MLTFIDLKIKNCLQNTLHSKHKGGHDIHLDSIVSGKNRILKAQNVKLQIRMCNLSRIYLVEGGRAISPFENNKPNKAS